MGGIETCPFLMGSALATPMYIEILPEFFIET